MARFNLSWKEREALTAFLQDLVRTPSPSTQEGAVAERIAAEMTRLGLQDVHTDRVGNLVGWVGPRREPRRTPGRGPVLMLNGHMDTVTVSDPGAWAHDPLGAEIEEDVLYGLGACDMKGGLAAMVYGAKLLLDAQVELAGDLVVACVVQEEPCEGLGTRVLIEEEGIRPEWVVLGEPTNLEIMRGQRGRVELRVITHGRSAHASRPDLGKNALYAATRLIFGLEMLAGQLGHDPFLGDGSLAVTDITCRAGSRNAVPDRCEFIVDRRLALGETEAKALAEVQRVIAREGVRAEVEVTDYIATSYTGCECRAREYFPAWALEKTHPLVEAGVRAVRTQLGRRPRVGQWSFSTEGAYTAGVAGIPTIGFGPGDERYAHTADDQVRLTDVFAAAGVYAQLAVELLGSNEERRE